MTDDANGMHAAVAAGVLAAENDFADLLRSVVEVARAIFGARASSILLLRRGDRRARLRRRGRRGRAGSRRAAHALRHGHRGLGAVVTRPPLVLEDVANDPRFAREVAEKTGFVPSGMMAAPLLADERALGVLQVLDRPKRSRFSLQEMELLGLFANQAAIALGLLDSTRRARAALDGVGDISVVARLAASLTRLEGERRAAGLALLEQLELLLSAVGAVGQNEQEGPKALSLAAPHVSAVSCRSS